MKKNNTLRNSVTRVSLITVGILMIPVIGMQLSREWDWNLADFLIMGTLLFSIGMLIELVRNKVSNTTHRVGLIVALVFALLYMWAELAVGIFTNLGS